MVLGDKSVPSVTVQNNSRLNQAREKVMQSRDIVNIRGMRLLAA